MLHDLSEIEELWPNGCVPAWVIRELTRSENGAFLISEMLLENVGPVVIVTTLIGPAIHGMPAGKNWGCAMTHIDGRPGRR